MDRVIEFYLEARSGVAPYQQLVNQVRTALRLDVLHVGDQLPTVKEVAASVAINPNTVLKAYRELEHLGLVAARPGVGTFVVGALGAGSRTAHEPLRRSLAVWLGRAREAGLDDESIEALFVTALRSRGQEEIA
jgi:GntR family transcriptional regulator